MTSRTTSRTTSAAIARRPVASTLLRLAGLAAVALPVFAHAMPAHVDCRDTFGNGQCIYGSADTGLAPMRVVDLATARDDINVRYGETVRFVRGDQSFIFTFNGLGGRNVSLSRIAPAGFDTGRIGVEVDADPSTQS